MSTADSTPRWDELFADLEAQASALAAGEIDAEVAERTRIESGQLGLVDRLRGAVGVPLRVRCAGQLLVTGTLRTVGSEWILLDEGAGREALVATASIQSVHGIGRLSVAARDHLTSRLGLRQLLREIARDRSPVRIALLDGSVLSGTIDRVGSDFVEVALHGAGEPRRRAEVADVAALAISAVAVVKREG